MAAELKLEANGEGVWLSAPGGEFSQDDVSQDDIYNLLRSHGIRRYDLKVIEGFLHSRTGEPCRIAFRNPDYEKAAKIAVSLSNENMTASVLIEAPFFTKPWPTESEILRALKEKAVVYGINRDVIREMLESRRCEEYVEVAKGLDPVEGKDAYIEYYINPDKPFEVSGDEKVDYWSRSMLVTVHPGQEVAVKHPAEAGKNGMSVIGTLVKAPTVKNVEFAFGEGLARSKENPLLLISTADGQLKNQKGKLVVLPELDVPGDVDFGIGSIDFTGAVAIRGSVRSGFHVIAQGNIDVRGMVEGADIDSQDSVTIHGGVRAMGKGYVQASGDVSVNFVDQATIRSGGNIIVKNAILHSQLYARKSVIVLGSGKKSQIAGGRIEAGLEVSCHVLGSEMGTKTEVVVGLPPEQIEKRRILQNEIKRCEENLEKIDPNLTLLKKMEAGGQIDDQKRAMLMNLTKMKFQLQAALESMNIELKDLEFQLGSLRDRGIVRVKEVCYSGVTISIRGIFYHVEGECKYTSFIVDEPTGTIVLRPFDYVMSQNKDA
ncbi:MAG: FapA family protein [Fretibacterium sp.]|nr:FapA family protein [Fretibacterium sp.]